MFVFLRLKFLNIRCCHTCEIKFINHAFSLLLWLIFLTSVFTVGLYLRTNLEMGRFSFSSVIRTEIHVQCGNKCLLVAYQVPIPVFPLPKSSFPLGIDLLPLRSKHVVWMELISLAALDVDSDWCQLIC